MNRDDLPANEAYFVKYQNLGGACGGKKRGSALLDCGVCGVERGFEAMSARRSDKAIHTMYSTVGDSNIMAFVYMAQPNSIKC